jgi:hypothetical protein
MWVKAIPLSKRYATVSKACSVSKELGDKAVAYLASSDVTEKKFRNIVPTPFGTK